MNAKKTLDTINWDYKDLENPNYTLECKKLVDANKIINDALNNMADPKKYRLYVKNNIKSKGDKIF